MQVHEWIETILVAILLAATLAALVRYLVLFVDSIFDFPEDQLNVLQPQPDLGPGNYGSPRFLRQAGDKEIERGKPEEEPKLTDWEKIVIVRDKDGKVIRIDKEYDQDESEEPGEYITAALRTVV